MKAIPQMSKLRYYSKDNSTAILAQTQKTLSSDIKQISHEMLCIFEDTITIEPSCYWDDLAYKQTINQLNILYRSQPNQINLNEEILEHFFIGYHTYKQITEIINALDNLNDNEEIKNRLYRIPTYISVVEGCLTNLFRVIILILDQISEKDFAPAKKLNPICEVLKSNNFGTLVSGINVNIRNAINHGGVIFKENGRTIDFQYIENRQSIVCSMKTYEFDALINKVYDISSAVLLGISTFINEHIDLISVDKNEKLYVPFCLLSLELSIPGIHVRNISGLPNDKQLNIDIEIKNPDRSYIGEVSIMLAMLVYERYSDYQQYMFFFSNERLQTSWVRFTNQEIDDMLNNVRTYAEVILSLQERKDFIIFDASTEPIDMQEIKYFRYPNYAESDFKINNVQDASLTERKRIRAHLFISEIENKELLLDIINRAINWLKNIKNCASPTMIIKHGNMEADAIYINVYKYDSRKNKELFPQNDNFVCFVDYNLNGETTLVNGGITAKLWNQMHHEKIDKLQIAWREKKYVISLNALCPCGSGKKYKRCCGKPD